MNPGADVSSIPALSHWHADLTTFRTEATESLASIALAIQQASNWLEEKLNFWQRETRSADEAVVQARAELSNRQFEDFRGRIPDCTVQEENLRRAEARLEHAQEQIRVVRHWLVHLPRLVNEAYEGHARRLMRFLEGDIPRGLALLDQRIRSLEAYAK